MDIERGDSLAMLICSIISALGSATIILTYYIFPNLYNKANAEIIFYLALSCLFEGMGSFVGEAKDHSPACFYQGMVTNIFSNATMIWTDIICFVIYTTVLTGKSMGVKFYFHLIAWGVSILLTLVQFVNSTYGTPGALGWCWVVMTSKTPSWGVLFWNWLSFYGVVWFSALFMVCFSIASALHMPKVSEERKWATSQALVKLRLYPFVVSICLILPTLFSNISNMPNFDRHGTTAKVLLSFSHILPCFQGFFTACVFWVTNGDVRQFWYILVTTGRIESVENGRMSILTHDETFRTLHSSSQKVVKTSTRKPQTSMRAMLDAISVSSDSKRFAGGVPSLSVRFMEARVAPDTPTCHESHKSTRSGASIRSLGFAQGLERSVRGGSGVGAAVAGGGSAGGTAPSEDVVIFNLDLNDDTADILADV